MTEKRWSRLSRRPYLEVAGVGSVSTSGLGAAQANSSDESTATVERTDAVSGETIFSDDFEDDQSGTRPDGWSHFANEDQNVVDDTASAGSQSFRMAGSPGGCWEATAYHSCPVPNEGETVFSGAVKPTTEGEIGCHSRRGRLIVGTTADDIYPDHGRRLLTFQTDSNITGIGGHDVGSYRLDEWNTYRISYQRTDGEVTVSYQFNGEDRGETTYSTATWEDDLSYLHLQSGDIAVYWDDFEVVNGNTQTEPPTGTLSGTATNHTGETINSGTVYLIDTVYESSVIDYIDSNGSLPTTDAETSVETGNFEFGETETGRYLVLIDPEDPYDSEYVEVSVRADESTTTSLTVDANRYLSPLDSEFDRLTTAAEGVLADSTADVARVYVDGARLFRDDLDEGDFLPGLLTIADQTLALANGVSSVGREIVQFAASEASVTFAQQGYNQVLATQFEEVAGTTFKGDLKSYTNKCLREDWITNLDETSAVSTARDAFDGTPMYQSALEEIDKADSQYEDLAYTEPADGFSMAEVKSVLKTQAKWLENNGAAPGVLVTPRGHEYVTRESKYHAGRYNALRENFEIAEAGETVSTGVSAAGKGIALVSASTGVGAAVGSAVSVIGSLGSLAFAMYQTKLKNQLGGAWVDSLRYWVSDLDDAYVLLFDIHAWLEKEVTNPTLQDTDGEITATDLGGTKYDGRTYAPANAPDYPLWWSLTARPQFKRHGTNTVSVSNTGDVSTTFHVISVDTYGDGKSEGVSDAVSMYPEEGTSTDAATLAPGDSTDVDIEYSSDFHPFSPFSWHHMSTSLWMNGKVVDEVEDLYYVVPSLDLIPVSASQSEKLAVEDSLTDEKLLEQPIETDAYVLTDASKSTAEPMTVDDWTSQVGDIQTLIDDTVTPTNSVVSTEYTVPTGVRGVVFTLSSPPDTELNIGVEDDQGQYVGYDPGVGDSVVEIPNAEYNGHESTLEVVSIPEASGTYTVEAEAVTFLGDPPASATLRAIEIPERNASLAISPAKPDTMVEPSTTATEQIHVSEAGGQVDMNVTDVRAGTFTTVNGDALSDVSISLSQSAFTVPAGTQDVVEFSADAASNVALPDGPETRFHGTITVETSNAGTSELDASVLVFDTDDQDVELFDVGSNVEGITVRSTESLPSEPPEGVVVTDSYEVETAGEDAVTLTFPYEQPSVGEELTAYQVGSEWTELDTSVGDRLTVEVPVPDTTDIALATQNSDPAVTVTAQGDTVPRAGQAEISIAASNVERVVVENLWTDWTIVETRPDGGTFSEDIATSGTCEFSWNAPQGTASVTLVVTPPQRYIGGDYVLSTNATYSNDTSGAKVTVKIRSE